MAITTRNDLPPEVELHYTGIVLSTPRAYLIHGAFANRVEIPPNSGDVARMVRYNRLETAPVPLNVNFENPPAQRFTRLDIDARLDWYSTYAILTRQLLLINQEKELTQAAIRLGQSYVETEDELLRDMLEGVASVYNAEGGANGDNPTDLSAFDIDNVVATLLDANADYVKDVIEGANKLGTGPVLESFYALGHTRLVPVLRNIDGFMQKGQYPSQTDLLKSEFGTAGNVRFFLSSRASVTANGSLLAADVYNTFIGGQEAYSAVSLNSDNVRYIYHAPGHGDDPAELRATAAWRMNFASVITNDAWIINTRSTLI